MFVDRFMSATMHYLCHYDYIQQTLSEDGNPPDVPVISPVPVINGVFPLPLSRHAQIAGGANQ
ncbi:MAG: inorganic diphosphatase [Burkholderiales bacterium]|nr:inorganic diphosphatase [Nitrosomonas sp.]MCP5275045.1 inorganic diphosphatase [Burkholderiales bacterium]